MKRQPTDGEKHLQKWCNRQGIHLQNLQRAHELNIKKQTTQSKNGQGGFPSGSVVKNLPANAGYMGLISNSGRPHMPKKQLGLYATTIVPML